jgi:hypothetical protein
MGMTLEGADEAMALLYQTGHRVTRGVVGQMRSEAEAIQKLAKKYAPLDHGNLEDAIKVKTLGGGRDELGRFMRKSFEVSIDMNATGHLGESISKYAYEMHELLLPYGAGGFNLGKLSRQKDAGRGVVGGRFLERAVSEVSNGTMNRLIQVAASYF